MNTYIINAGYDREITVRADYINLTTAGILYFFKVDGITDIKGDKYEEPVAMFKTWEYVYMKEGQ